MDTKDLPDLAVAQTGSTHSQDCRMKMLFIWVK